MLALIERLLQARPTLEILVTTGTVTSARLLESRLPARARHQFVPADMPRWIARFLDHWRPDLALWVESELWPNLILATWDRFHLALPFGRGVYLFGEPIEIAAELDEEGLEGVRRLLETRMVEMVGEADRLVGHGLSQPILAGDARRPAGPVAGD